MIGATLSGGRQYVGNFGSPAAIAKGTVVSAGGREVVTIGGKAVGTKVMSGGTIVFAGGAVSGLSIKSGGTIDLEHLAFQKGEKLTFVENKAHTAGILKVTNGVTTQTVALFGQYVAAGFSLTRDGAGGTAIHYAPVSATHVIVAAHH